MTAVLQTWLCDGPTPSICDIVTGRPTVLGLGVGLPMGIWAEPTARCTCTQLGREEACRSETLLTRATPSSSSQATSLPQPAGGDTREHDPEHSGGGKPWRGGAHVEAPNHRPATSQLAQVGAWGYTHCLEGSRTGEAFRCGWQPHPHSYPWLSVCRPDILLPMQQGEVLCSEMQQPTTDCLLGSASSPSYVPA